jgi:CHAD domain-containing protein
MKNRDVNRVNGNTPLPSAASFANSSAISLTKQMTVPRAFFALAEPVVEQVCARARELEVDEDAETVHKLRVALRRLRALWWAFAPLMESDQSKLDREEFKRLAEAAGDIRDWDVLGQLLSSDGKFRTRIGSIAPAITEQRQLALESSRATLKNADIATLMRTALLGTLHQLEGRGDDLITEFAEARVRKAEKALKARIKQAHRRKRPDYEALHAVRIAGKKLRYLLEFFAPILKGRHEKAIKRLTTIQTRLGNLNDLVVSEVRLRETLPSNVTEDDLKQTLSWMLQQKKQHLRSAQKHLARIK